MQTLLWLQYRAATRILTCTIENFWRRFLETCLFAKYDWVKVRGDVEVLEHCICQVGQLVNANMDIVQALRILESALLTRAVRTFILRSSRTGQKTLSGYPAATSRR